MNNRAIALALAALLVACSEDPTEPDDAFISAEVFTAFDDDSDEVLTSTEFRSGVHGDDWFGDLDDDDDELLGEQEFDDEMGDDVELFPSFDANADGGIDATEFIDGLFDTFDVDDDDGVSRAEFTAGVEIFDD